MKIKRQRAIADEAVSRDGKANVATEHQDPYNQACREKAKQRKERTL